MNDTGEPHRDAHVRDSLARDGLVRPLDPMRGTNQAGVRLYNERLVLSLIRQHGALPKAEIARLTGLSAQTISVIMNGLDSDGLLLRGSPRKGKVGQPSVPFAINPEGALSFGVKIGRRSTDLVLVDFLGGIREQIRTTHQFPLPEIVTTLVRDGLEQLVSGLTPDLVRRVVGLGIATPFELWNWEDEVGAPSGDMQAWRDFDSAAEIQKLCPWPVYLCNDGTAACAAECFFGPTERQMREYLYVFLGSFIGGGIVLNGNVVQGRSGNAGAIGSLPVGGPNGTEQLIRRASLIRLEDMIREAGGDPQRLWTTPTHWPDFGAPLEAWLSTASAALAWLAASAAAIIDFEAIVIDGAVPPAIRERLVAMTEAAYQRLDLQGLSPLEFVEGSIGWDARAIGAAALPLLATFARDHEVMFKEDAHA